MNPEEKQAVASITPSKVFRYELRLRVLAAVVPGKPILAHNRLELVDLLVAVSLDIEALDPVREALDPVREALIHGKGSMWPNHPHVRAVVEATLALHPTHQWGGTVVEFAYVCP